MSSRRLTILVAVVIAAAACTPVQPEVTRPTGAPAYPPTEFVDMLDSQPARPYTVIGTIDAPGEVGSTRTQVIAQIRAKAQQMGADAVILQDQSRSTPAAPRLNPSTGQYESVGGQLVPAFKGVAIKYK
jgi:hypothetical protein